MVAMTWQGGVERVVPRAMLHFGFGVVSESKHSFAGIKKVVLKALKRSSQELFRFQKVPFQDSN